MLTVRALFVSLSLAALLVLSLSFSAAMLFGAANLIERKLDQDGRAQDSSSDAVSR